MIHDLHGRHRDKKQWKLLRKAANSCTMLGEKVLNMRHCICHRNLGGCHLVDRAEVHQVPFRQQFHLAEHFPDGLPRLVDGAQYCALPCCQVLKMLHQDQGSMAIQPCEPNPVLGYALVGRKRRQGLTPDCRERNRQHISWRVCLGFIKVCH